MQRTIYHPGIGEVTLSRTRRSTRISLSVKTNGALRLSFPTWVAQKRALGFLDEKIDWIAETRKKLAEKYPNAAQDQPGKEPQTPEEAAARAAERAAGATAVKQKIEKLRVEAKAVLPEMVARLAAEHAGHGIRYGAVRIKASRSKWGSCTARNDLNLSLFLMELPRYLAEYVVLHELCHTVHHNHSPRFHALLDAVTRGHHRALNKELRSHRPGA